MPHEVKLVAIDLDGTLLNSNNTVSERNVTVIKQAIEQGIEVIIATGKTRVSATETIERLGLTTPGIYLQGLAIYESDGSISFQKTLSPDIARKVITFAEDRGYQMVAYSGNRILVRTEFPKGNELATKYGEPMPEAVGSLQNILDEMPVHKLIAVKPGEPKKIRALRWQLEIQLSGKATLVQAMIPDMVEILPPGVSKATALKSLLKRMNISAENVMAIGDGENDIEMLQLAQIPVAIGNADERLRAVAKHFVASNDEDGVAEAIERFALKTTETTDTGTAKTDETSNAATIEDVETTAEETTE